MPAGICQYQCIPLDQRFLTPGTVLSPFRWVDFKRQKESLSSFWIKVRKEKPNLGGEALKRLIPFATIFLCEAGFPAVAATEIRHGARLQPEDGPRCGLSSKSLRFEEQIEAIQCQGCHWFYHYIECQVGLGEIFFFNNDIQYHKPNIDLVCILKHTRYNFSFSKNHCIDLFIVDHY